MHSYCVGAFWADVSHPEPGAAGPTGSTPWSARSPHADPAAHDLIADAIAAAQAGHAAAHHARRAEQAAARARTDQSRRGDRPVPDRVRERHPRRRSLAGRLAQLKARSGQLAALRDELASQLAMAPTTPPAPTLHQVADCIDEITASGSQS